MDMKIIKNEAEYEAALTRIEGLMDATPDSPEEGELELLALLVEKYEGERYPIDLPDPIAAVKFRMDQEGLKPEDMVAYLGSQSKVSEVLNYKRPLSLTMIRSLNQGMGIPAEVLLQDPGQNTEGDIAVWREYPFNELFKRGYFGVFRGSLLDARARADELLDDLFSVFQGAQPELVYCKRGEREINTNALKAWQARVIQLALTEGLPLFSRDEFTKEFLHQVVQLSYYSQGPQIVRELLNKKGIHFIVLQHLPETYLDGACFYAPDGRPVIGLTLRHDRLDNFWFTIVHELAHLYLHLDGKNIAFFDDTEQPVDVPGDPQENEANAFTSDMLFSHEVWEEVGEDLIKAQDERPLLDIAERITISPAIVAGRVRWETGDYSRFPTLVGYKKVREQFTEYG